MKLVATMPCRNEAWVLPASIRTALCWCDELIVLDHSSTDQTPRVLDELSSEYPGRLHRLAETNAAWNEADIRQRLLTAARERGATHIALVDADELLTANLHETIRGVAENMRPGECLKVPWLCCWRSLNQYRCDDSPFGRATVSLIFRDAPALAHRGGPGGYQIHTRIPCGAWVNLWGERSRGGVLHFQHAVWRRLLAKQALYQVNEVLNYPHRDAAAIRAMYGPTVDESDARFALVPADWWTAGARESIDLDAEPWQEREVRRLVAEHGRERFAGINLFDVA